MHIQKERQLLLAFSLIFAVLAFTLFGYGLTTKAAENTLTTTQSKYFVEYRTSKTADDGSLTFVSSGTINSSMQIIAWFQDVDYQLYQGLVDAENKKLYLIRNTAITNCCRWVNVRTDVTDNEKGTTKTTVDLESAVNTENKLTQGHLTLVFKNGTYEYSGMIFDSYENAKNYAATGSTTGMIKGDDNPILDGFDGEYDSSVPIPHLTNLSHNGFRISNNATTLELDLQVKSYFYGLKHNGSHTVGKVPNPLYYVDKGQLCDEHTYVNIINSEIGFTGSEVVLTDETYFKCKNRLDLFSDGIEYFHTAYPSHKNLPDYDFWWHSNSGFDTWWNKAKSAFSANQDLDAALDLTGQAVTKYYVRFRELRPTDVAGVYEEVPGQWYCYTYQTGKSTSVSPIEGDPSGNPIETDPIDGWQDDDGNPIYTDPNLPNIDTSNPVQMLQDFIDFLVGLPSQLGQISLFLKEAFCFIPEKYWTVLFAGVGFAVVFLIFRALK